MFHFLRHQIFINLYYNSRKKLFGSFASNVVYTEKELLHFGEIQRLLCTIWLYYYQILSGIKLEPSPIPVIRDGIRLLQFSYLLVAFLVNTKKQAAVQGNSSHRKKYFTQGRWIIPLKSQIHFLQRLRWQTQI